MDIHKPKPWHSAREFLKEYLIIVVGVLTALGGEQIVEWAHRSDEIREARESIHDEIATDMSIVAYGMDERRCLNPYLDAYDAWASGGAPRPTEHGLLTLPLRSSAWETVKTGAVTHMPLKERLALAEVYDWIANYQQALKTTRDASMDLHAIWARGADLDRETAGRLREGVKRARNMANVLRDNARVILASGGALGVKPKARADLRPVLLRDALATTCVAPTPAPANDR